MSDNPRPRRPARKRNSLHACLDETQWEDDFQFNEHSEFILSEGEEFEFFAKPPFNGIDCDGGTDVNDVKEKTILDAGGSESEVNLFAIPSVTTDNKKKKGDILSSSTTGSSSKLKDANHKHDIPIPSSNSAGSHKKEPEHVDPHSLLRATFYTNEAKTLFHTKLKDAHAEGSFNERDEVFYKYGGIKNSAISAFRTLMQDSYYDRKVISSASGVGPTDFLGAKELDANALDAISGMFPGSLKIHLFQKQKEKKIFGENGELNVHIVYHDGNFHAADSTGEVQKRFFKKKRRKNSKRKAVDNADACTKPKKKRKRNKSKYDFLDPYIEKFYEDAHYTASFTGPLREKAKRDYDERFPEKTASQRNRAISARVRAVCGVVRQPEHTPLSATTNGLGEINSKCDTVKNAEYQRGWMDNNPEYQRGWMDNNPEYHRAWRAANPEYHPEYHRVWRAANPEKQREYCLIEKQIRIAENIEEIKRHGLKGHLRSDEDIIQRADDIFKTPLEILDGKTPSQAIKDQSHALYFGTTKKWPIELESLRWLTERGRTDGGRNRPVLRYFDEKNPANKEGKLITTSEAKNKLNFKSEVLDSSRLRLDSCNLEDCLQSKIDDQPLGTARLHRYIAMGYKQLPGELEDKNFVCRCFVTALKIEKQVSKKDKDGKRRPDYIVVNGTKLKICY
eukprot:g975.t1